MTGTEQAGGRLSVPADGEARSVGRRWIIFARALNVVFRPNYYPTVAFFFLLNFTFLQMLPLLFRLYVLFIVYALTFAVPHIGTYLYNVASRKGTYRLRSRYGRLVPYVINILSYLVCIHFVWKLRMPSFVLAVLAVAVCMQCVCTVVSVWWKICVHSAAVGATIGTLVVVASVLGFNPVWWLCLVILISGLVNSSCMLLRRHTLWQVVGGTWIGIGCGLVSVILV